MGPGGTAIVVVARYRSTCVFLCHTRVAGGAVRPSPLSHPRCVHQRGPAAGAQLLGVVRAAYVDHVGGGGVFVGGWPERQH